MESARAAAKSSLTIAIVQRAFVWIAQHVVSLGDRLEPLLGVFRSIIAIRMVLHRQLAIRLLDFVVAGAAHYTEHVVKISHAFLDSPSTNQSPTRTCA